MTNQKLSLAFKKLGFHKSSLQMTRMGISYTYKDSGALFTFPKSHKEQFQISAPGYNHQRWSCFMLSDDIWEEYQQNPYIDWHWDKTKPFNGELSPMEALLCIARGFARMVDAWEVKE
tara:strand:+ start:1084 stop:1437 length:354 start_codon:yes stop_codon:yes gene_type:complete